MGMPIVFIGITLSGATLCQKMERAKKIEAVSSERLEELKASYVDKGMYTIFIQPSEFALVLMAHMP